MLDQSKKTALIIYNILVNGPDKRAGMLARHVLEDKERWEPKGYSYVDFESGFTYPKEHCSLNIETGGYYDKAFRSALGNDYLSLPETTAKHRPSDQVLIELNHSKGCNHYNINLAELCRRLPKIMTAKDKDLELLKAPPKATFGAAGRPGFAIIIDANTYARFADNLESRPFSEPEERVLAEKNIDPASVVAISDPNSLSLLAPIMNFAGASNYLPKQVS